MFFESEWIKHVAPECNEITGELRIVSYKNEGNDEVNDGNQNDVVILATLSIGRKLTNVVTKKNSSKKRLKISWEVLV